MSCDLWNLVWFRRCLFGVFALLAAAVSPAAKANTWWVVECANCYTEQDFIDTGVNFARLQVAPGVYLVMSKVHPRTAFVKVTGNVVQRCAPTEPCWEELDNASGTTQDADGNPLYSAGDYESVDQGLFGTKRQQPIAPIDVDPEYGGSYINNQALEEDTNSAIIRVLYIERGYNPNDIKIGTIVTVRWADGTKAQFIRTNLVGSYQWKYVEGSARNANGDKIDASGGVITSNSNTGGGGTATGTGSSGYSFVSAGGAYCQVRTTIDVDGYVTSHYTGYIRCY